MYTQKAQRTPTIGLDLGIKDAKEARQNALEMGDVSRALAYAEEIKAFELELSRRLKGLCIVKD
jgi:hypothetical protein